MVIQGPAGLLHCESSKPEGGPVSQMELHYYDEEEEQSSISAKPMVPTKVVGQCTPQPDCPEDAQWDTGEVISRS